MFCKKSLRRKFIFLALIGQIVINAGCLTSTKDMTKKPVRTFDYASQWLKVDSLMKINQPKSTLDLVTMIKNNARKDQETADFIRAIFYESDLAATLNEDGLLSSIAIIENELSVSDPNLKALLNSRLGELYQRYAQENAWRLPATEGDIGETSGVGDFSRQTLIALADSAYLGSLDGSTKSESLSHYEDLLSSTIRPPFYTELYDLLARRAVLYFAQERVAVPSQIGECKVDKIDFFGNASTFVQVPLHNANSQGPICQALQIYQKVLKHHQSDKDPALMVDWDLQRLQTVYRESTLTNRDSMYLDALQDLVASYNDGPAFAQITAVFAQHMLDHDDGSQLDLLKDMHTQCKEAIQKYPDSYGAGLCRAVLSRIEAKSLDLSIEEVLLPAEKSLVLLNYRNVDHVYVKVVKLSDDEQLRHELSRRNDDVISTLRKMPPTYITEVDLSAMDDFRAHSTEFVLPGFDRGYYAILVGTDPRYSVQGSAVALGRFTASAISVIEQKFANRGRFRCFDRSSGYPITDALITWYQYDDRQPSRMLIKQGTITTDEQGEGEIAALKDLRGRYSIKIEHNADQLWIDHLYNYPVYYATNKGLHLQLFTDRSIYRPGQIVHFKGLAMQKDERGRPEILKDQSISLTLLDVNGQKVMTSKYVSNTFGSIAGTFLLPTEGLNGSYSISNSIDERRHTFQVESYKRPAFYVDLEKPSDDLVLGDTVSLAGLAKSYAGVPLGAATVKYRVVRKAAVRYFDYGYRGWPGLNLPDEEVANGEMRTADDGRFELEFKTERVNSHKGRWFRPRFHYEVMVDVMDINGETQSGAISLNLGNDPFRIQVPLAPSNHQDSLKTIEVSTLNFVNEPISVNGKLKVLSVQSPAEWTKERRWQIPDRPQLDIDQLQVEFPKYSHVQNDPSSWPVLETVREITFESKGVIKIELGTPLPAGYYRIEVEAVSAQGSSSISTFMMIHKPKSSFVPVEDLLFVPSTTMISKPGATVTLDFATPIKGKIFWYAERQGKLERGTWIDADGWTSVQVPITEEDLGGLTVHAMVGFENRVVHKQIKIVVPWSNKELSVKYENFRDKTRPGSREMRKVTIEGEQGEGLWSELLVSMYDVSLDQFRPHTWSRNFYPNHQSALRHKFFGFGVVRAQLYANQWMVYAPSPDNRYPSLIYNRVMMGSRRYRSKLGVPMTESSYALEDQIMQDESVENEVDEYRSGEEETPSSSPIISTFQLREKFQETAFFYPQMYTDKKGNLSFEFEMNDALTTWRMMSLAHTQDLKTGYHEGNIISQKELMITPNSPRFLRAGDTFTFVAKIDNLSGEAQVVDAKLQLENPLGNEVLDDLLTSSKIQQVVIEPAKSMSIAWTVKIPTDWLHPIMYTIQATAGRYSDAQRDVWPILQNRKLVTETLAMTIAPDSNKSGQLNNLINHTSKTLEHTNLVIDMVSNPSWYAIQAMPYILEYPHESSEQIFNRYMVSNLAQKILEEHHDIRATISGWNLDQKDANQLIKDQALKSAAIEETPWVKQAMSEQSKLGKLAMIFDDNNLRYETTSNLDKLILLQKQDGGFAWFPGGRSNWYITQYIVEGFAHMKGWQAEGEPKIEALLEKALNYLDQQALQYHQEVEKRLHQGQRNHADDHLVSLMIHYLYTRSHYPEYKLDEDMKHMWSFYLGQAAKHWTHKSLYEQGMLASMLHREGDGKTVSLIIKSLRELLLEDENLGPHWKYDRGYLWSQAPIETHVLLMDVFGEIEQDNVLVERLKIWLINQKRTRRWSDTKATAAAIRALSTGTNDWFIPTKALPEVILGGRTLEIGAGHSTGKNLWIRQEIAPQEIRPKDGRISIKNRGNQPIWGSVFWQYLEDLDKLSSANDTPLTIQKKIFVERLNTEGRKLDAIESADLQIGDKVVIQLVMSAVQDMEFIHIQDQRAGALEPTEVISGYRWEDGLGYYRSTSDTHTDFFVEYLPKGRYVIEYSLRVAQSGDFSNGIGMIQSMYAPDFAAHSEGIRLDIGVRQ